VRDYPQDRPYYCVVEGDVQRLFSTFPNGWPGRALLFLRLVAAAPLLQQSIAFICGITHSSVLALELVALASAVLLALGFFTPMAALLLGAVQVWLAFQADEWLGVHSLLAAIGVSLAMLGPGAWSIDAHLFGRKRIDFPPSAD
jgi:putative oxidoreductase